MTHPPKFDARGLKLYAQRFGREWEQSPTLKERREIHERRRRRAKAMMTRSRIPTLNESELRELFSDSEAFRFWSSQEYEFGKRLEKHGLPGLRELLLELVSRGERGPNATHLQAIWARRGLGPQLATELLAYRFPARFAPNSKEIIAALQFFGLESADTAQSTLGAGKGAKAKGETAKWGSDVQAYLARCRSLETLKAALQTGGLPSIDFLTVQAFAWWLGQSQTLEMAAREIEVVKALERALTARGLQFSQFALAAFFTALQTKGFVLLTGISGVGKTQLARAFAEILRGGGAPVHADGTLAATVSPALLQSGRVPLPPHRFAIGDRVLLSVDGHSQNARVMAGQNGAGELVLRGVARRWLESNLSVGDVLRLEPEIDRDRDAVNFRLFASHAASQPVEREANSNLLFLPVRPDWRDGKSLLGYFNPLTNRYESTPFLQFLMRAVASFRARDGRAWFVLLDEMNLARVEHYFADLLSILETGRDEHGWTREALRFDYPENATGETPPRELFLPPNLFFIGTVNLDESTHTFSPKVLDRAWTLQLDAVDFRDYPPAPRDETNGGDLTSEERRALWQVFTGEGRFQRAGKTSIAPWAQEHRFIGVRLQALNEQLRRHGLHFGYRVFDEILAFLMAAQSNGAFNTDSGNADSEDTHQSTLDAAFDAAIAAKVLSRLHGSRERLQGPLCAILSWCINPDAPDVPTITRIFERVTTTGDIEAAWLELTRLDYRLPHSAAIASDLWRAAWLDGYALFGAV